MHSSTIHKRTIGSNVWAFTNECQLSDHKKSICRIINRIKRTSASTPVSFQRGLRCETRALNVVVTAYL